MKITLNLLILGIILNILLIISFWFNKDAIISFTNIEVNIKIISLFIYYLFLINYNMVNYHKIFFYIINWFVKIVIILGCFNLYIVSDNFNFIKIMLFFVLGVIISLGILLLYTIILAFS